MADRKLPTEKECEEFAEHVAEDMKPKGSWDSEEYEMFWFKPYQLNKLIKFCQGQPIQDELWGNN